MRNLHRGPGVVALVVICLVVAGLFQLARAQTCATPACTFTNPPAAGTTTTRYDLSARTTPASCGFSYWVDCGYGTPAWGSGSNELCTYPAIGGTGGRAYSWAIKVGNASKTYCEKSGSTTVYDCQLACGAATVPATGKVGEPITFSTTATASHCLNGPTYSWDVPGFSYCGQSSCQFTFTSPGVYNWRVVVMAQAGNNPTSFPSCRKEGTITIGAGDLQVGSITFKADAIVQQGTDYTLTGHVRANDMLLFSDKATFRGTPSTGTGDLFTSGTLTVATLPVPTRITSGANQYYLVDGRSATGKLQPQLVPPSTLLDFRFAGLSLYLADRTSAVAEIGLSVDGVIVTPYLYVGRAEGFSLGELRIGVVLPPGERPRLGGMQLVNGSGAPGVRIDAIRAMSYSRTDDTLTGTLDVDFPFLDVQNGAGAKAMVPMDFVVEDGCINSLETSPGGLGGRWLQLGPGDRPFIQASGIALTSICDQARYAPLVFGSFHLSRDLNPGLAVPGSVWLYEPPRMMRLVRGTPAFLDRDVLDAGARLIAAGNLDALFLKGGFGTGGLSGGRDVLRGTLACGTARVGSSGVNWWSYGTVTGSFALDSGCRCADADGDTCKLARSALLELYNGATIPPAAFTLKAAGATGASSIEYAARLTGTNVFAGLSSLQARVDRSRLTGQAPTVRCFLGSNLAGRPTTKPTSLLDMQATAVERSVTLGHSEQIAVFGVTSKTSTLPSIYLKTPSGLRLTPSTVGQLAGAWYAADTEAKLALIAVKNAAAGAWVIGEDNLPESDVELSVLAPQPPPVTTFTSVQTSGSSTSMTVAVAPPAAGTKVSLCTSRIKDGLPESVIASELPATTGSVTATWDTSALPSGDYYLFALTDDGRNAPITTYHATPITVDTAGLAAPTNLQATRSGETVTLTWTRSTSSAVVGYEVRYTDAPDAPGYPFTGSAPLPTGMTLGDLGYTKGYRLCVAAYNLDGSFSPCSSTVVVGPGKGRARRHLP